jgi:hypothetical protein
VQLNKVMLMLDAHPTPGRPTVSARAEVTSVALIEPSVRVPLAGVSLVFGISEIDVEQDVTHHLRVAITGPAGSTAHEEDVPRANITAGAMTKGLDLSGMAIPAVGVYTFEIALDGQLLGTLPLEATLARGRLRAVFLRYAQNELGIAEGDQYIRVRIVFDLYARDAFVGRIPIRVSQPQGLNFLTDPLTIEVPPGYERLARSPDFQRAVRDGHNHWVLELFGGKFPSGGRITMAQNTFTGGGATVEFDLTDEEPAVGTPGGW